MPIFTFDNLGQSMWRGKVQPGDIILADNPLMKQAINFPISGRMLTGLMAGRRITISCADFTRIDPAVESLPETICNCRQFDDPPRHHLKYEPGCAGDTEGPFCSSCGQPAAGGWSDSGIGAYEYWGMKGNDSRIEYVSLCCNAQLFDDCECTSPTTPEEEYQDEP